MKESLLLLSSRIFLGCFSYSSERRSEISLLPYTPDGKERDRVRNVLSSLQACRPIINPNLGFWKQLVDFERRLRGEKGTVDSMTEVVTVGTPTVTLVPCSTAYMPVPDVYSHMVTKVP